MPTSRFLQKSIVVSLLGAFMLLPTIAEAQFFDAASGAASAVTSATEKAVTDTAIETAKSEGVKTAAEAAGTGVAGSIIGSGIGATLAGNAFNLISGTLGLDIGNGVPTNDFQGRLARQESKFKFTLDGLAWVAINRVIAQMTKSVVSWINSGFEGSPAFVTDPKAFFLDVADQVSGAYIQKLGLSQALCSPFRARILLSLTEYARRPIPRYSCTLSAAIQNIDNFVTNFNNGGWGTWIALSRRENNPYAQIIDQAAELDREKAVEANFKQQELQWGRGFISMRDPYNTNKIVTPGSVIEKQLNDTLDSSQRRLEVADSVNEVITALADQLISKLLTGASGLLGTTQKQPGSTLSYFDQAAISADRDSLYARESILSFMKTDLTREQEYLAAKQNSLTAVTNTRTALQTLQKCYLGDRSINVAALPTGLINGTALGGSPLVGASQLPILGVTVPVTLAVTATPTPTGDVASLVAAASSTIATELDPLIVPLQTSIAGSNQLIAEISSLSGPTSSAATVDGTIGLANGFANRHDSYHNESDVTAAQQETAGVIAKVSPILQDTQAKLIDCKRGIIR